MCHLKELLNGLINVKAALCLSLLGIVSRLELEASWPAVYFPVPSRVPELVLHTLANESIKEMAGQSQVAMLNHTSSCAAVCYPRLSSCSSFPRYCCSVWHSPLITFLGGSR